MTPALIAIARAVVALPGWEWWPGTRYLVPPAWADGWMPSGRVGDSHSPGLPPDARDPVPDPTDPATGGVLLSLLGPGWMVDAQVEGSPYVVYRRVTDRSWLGEHWSGATLAEACCCAALAVGRWPGRAP